MPPLVGFQDTVLTHQTPLRRIKDWKPQPSESAVRCLVSPSLSGGRHEGYRYDEARNIALRVALQAHIPTEVGERVFPTPMLEAYAPYDKGTHQVPPRKQHHILNPFENGEAPYWFVQEVSV
ncbi:hypothetical protein CF392_11970 [Tamilnaduibacter salinus]|uniref:Uncharacterized protein n=1 Tax=Tamilnaduibacter salinus TaxID=1484056 RepID=A0A2A2I1Q6_9GAMM|nr:hypothetical protein [Tamilnaduibacter salinus]PAV25246.1 hypothetical protein CF392_11970 [Tamilnaduibacter salinus]